VTRGVGEVLCGQPLYEIRLSAEVHAESAHFIDCIVHRRT